VIRRRLILAGVALLALAGSFGAGRYSRPAKVVTVDKVRTEVQYRDRVVTQIQHDVQVQHDVAVQTRTVTQWRTGPDKVTTVTQYVDRDRTSETKRQDRGQTKQDASSEARSLVTELHTASTVYARPAWSATLLAGGQLGGRRLTDALPAPLVLGVAVERRLVGPVSAGLWATSGMAAGLAVRLDW